MRTTRTNRSDRFMSCTDRSTTAEQTSPITPYFSALNPNPLAAVLRTLSHASHTYGADVDRLHAAFKDEY
jgi:hypothetical protein